MRKRVVRIDCDRPASQFDRLVIILQPEIGRRLAVIPIVERRVGRARQNCPIEIFNAFCRIARGIGSRCQVGRRRPRCPGPVRARARVRPWLPRCDPGPKDDALYVVRPSPIWIEGEHLRLHFIGSLEVAFRVAGNAKQRRHQELDPQCLQGADIAGIDGERLFAERVCRIRFIADVPALVQTGHALERQILGAGIGRGRPLETGAFGLGQLQLHRSRQMRDDRVLRLQQIGA